MTSRRQRRLASEVFLQQKLTVGDLGNLQTSASTSATHIPGPHRHRSKLR
jgi:hypothetical protein